MKFCYECGTELTEKYLEREGMVQFCPKCKQFRFPIFNTAVSMEVLNPAQTHVLLIQQYGKTRNILVAGYVSRGEQAEQTVAREVQEETGLHVHDITFRKSQFFEPSNTLMLNFSCVADSDDLSGITDEIDRAAWFPLEEASQAIAQNSLAQAFLDNFLQQRVQ
ncbi:NAD(+) diphosphatase [Butyricicoccus sp.]|uniref:NAD(+) diphosphatase n=1 Tax=Butyricicoccus sp. TaxID=2049021 RepID=UPI0037367547